MRFCRQAIAALVLLAPCAAFGAATVSSSSTTCTSVTGIGSTAWTSPSNAQTSNDSRADTNLSGGGTSNWLKCTGFGFSLSSDQKIRGILVEVEGYSQRRSTYVSNVRLVKAGTIQTTDRGNITTAELPRNSANEAFISFGGSADTWDGGYTYSDINDSTFGVAVAVYNSNGQTSDQFVDSIRVTVYHVPPLGDIYATGFDSFTDFELDGTKVGSPTISTSSPISGTGSLVISKSAGVAQAYCAPTSIVDPELSLQGYARFNVSLNSATSPIAVGACVPIAYWLQESSVIGGYVSVCRPETSKFTLDTYYDGGSGQPQEFGPTPRFNSSTTAHSIEVNQLIQPIGPGLDKAAVILAVDGTVYWKYYLTTAADCSGTNCDIDTFCLGSPATAQGVNTPAISSLKFDGMVVNNDDRTGPGRVVPIRAFDELSGSWSQTGCSNKEDCLNSWLTTSAPNGCSSGNRIQRSLADTVPELFDWNSLSPALSTGESISALFFYGVGCDAAGTTATVYTSLLSNSQAEQTQFIVMPADSSAQPLRGTWQLDPGDGGTSCSDDATCTALYGANARCVGSGCWGEWGETRLNNVQVGFFKSGANGDARISAGVLYAVIDTPAPPPNTALQDWRGYYPNQGDGHITLNIDCDSISTSTNTFHCVNPPSNTCTKTCSVDGDCDGSGTVACIDGRCNQSCEFNGDCDCATDAYCWGSGSIANQISTLVPVTDMLRCGANGQTQDWWKNQIPYLFTGGAQALGDFCVVVKGSLGHCDGNDTPCATDAECSEYGVNCIPHIPDYDLNLCGGNDCLDTLGDCDPIRDANWAFFQAGNRLTSRLGDSACPFAASTPGAYEGPLHDASDCDGEPVACTTNAEKDAWCTSKMGAASMAVGYCAGHSDPVWSCMDDLQCSTCENDSDIPCGGTGEANGQGFIPVGRCYPGNQLKKHSCDCRCNGGTADGDLCSGAIDCPGGACDDCDSTQCPQICEGGSNDEKICTADTDCPGGTCPSPTVAQCQAYSEYSSYNFWRRDSPCGDPTEMCAHDECMFDHLYCTVPCYAITCTTDDDCQAPTRPWGGRCDSGHCTACGTGGQTKLTLDDPLNRAVVKKRWYQGRGLQNPRKIVDSQLAMANEVEGTYGARQLFLNYGPSGRYYPEPEPITMCLNELDRIQRTELPHFFDIMHYSMHSLDRTGGLGSDSSGIVSDYLHLTQGGAGKYAESIGGGMNNMFPVCDGDMTQACGGCFVPCTDDADCDPGTCSGGFCTCDTGNPTTTCPTNTTCKSVIPLHYYTPGIGGTPGPTPTPANRCISTLLTDCPAGNPNATTETRIIAADNVCSDLSKGLCREEATQLRCADAPDTICANDGDCPSGICSTDAAWVPCNHSGSCRHDGYHSADVCDKATGLCKRTTSTPTQTPTQTPTTTPTTP